MVLFYLSMAPVPGGWGPNWREGGAGGTEPRVTHVRTFWGFWATTYTSGWIRVRFLRVQIAVSGRRHVRFTSGGCRWFCWHRHGALAASVSILYGDIMVPYVPWAYVRAIQLPRTDCHRALQYPHPNCNWEGRSHLTIEFILNKIGESVN